jgi:ribonuclease P protein component
VSTAEPPPAPRRGSRFPLARHRLRRADFARVYRKGQRARGRVLLVVVLENGLALSRLGLSVSKRHARRAVVRNRTRRVFREAFRLGLAELPVGLDVVMIPVAAAPQLAATRSELAELVERALRKARR